jgi:hypothetical protein
MLLFPTNSVPCGAVPQCDIVRSQTWTNSEWKQLAGTAHMHYNSWLGVGEMVGRGSISVVRKDLSVDLMRCCELLRILGLLEVSTRGKY